MAKHKEKEVAKKYFIEFCKTQKEIAEDLGLTEKTVGKWVSDGNWKALRDARINSSQNQATNIKSLISDLTDRAIEVNEKIKLIEAKGKSATTVEKDELLDRKSTRLNSSHVKSSYAVFCL